MRKQLPSPRSPLVSQSDLWVHCYVTVCHYESIRGDDGDDRDKGDEGGRKAGGLRYGLKNSTRGAGMLE